MSILVTTLGPTWQVVPELLGFTNPEFMDLYRNHPQKARIADLRRQYGIESVKEVWAVTTEGAVTDAGLNQLWQWCDAVSEDGRPAIRVWRVAATDDLTSEAECRRLGEAILRTVMHAAEAAGPERLLLSLTGGRKTMSTDLQKAAELFGCQVLLHVIDNLHNKDIKGLKPADFKQPLKTSIAKDLMPLIAGRYPRNPIVDMDGAGGRLPPSDFPLPMPEDRRPEVLKIQDTALLDEVDRRRRDARYLYCNYTENLLRGDRGANFLALYSLPPADVNRLKALTIGADPRKEADELKALQVLPKAELHCHLGGIADAAETIEIAQAARPVLERCGSRVMEWLVDRWSRSEFEGPSTADRIFKELGRDFPDIPRHVCTTALALLFEDRPMLLDEILFGPFQDESVFINIGIEAYEGLGDLQGSGLLQTPESIRTACRILAQKAARHNVRYLELRCSPANYTRGGLSAAAVARVIDESLGEFADFDYSLLFIASRHGKMSRVHEHVELAEDLMGTEALGFPSLRGFDLAGNEKVRSAGQMREALLPLMEKCIHLTIHAGETEDVQSIWEAVYHLSAERIGHGLRLIDNPRLLERFVDRNIALEMCPSSNVQTVGFRDNYLPSTDVQDEYPLKSYLQAGLRVTVNTDNPGISRTDFTRELHRAARLTPGGLSLWEVLMLVRNGFKASFADRDRRQRLILDAEKEIIRLMREGWPHGID